MRRKGKKGDRDFMDCIERTTRKNYVYRGRILNVRCDDALLPNDEPCKREIVEHSGGAAVLCVKDGKIAFVRQYRYAYQKTLTEIPAGKLEFGEDPLAAARRELAEETGIYAENLKKIAEIYPSPGYTDEVIYVYFADGGKAAEQHLDEDEFLSVEWLSEEEAKRRLLDGEFRDAKTAIALQYYFLQKENKQEQP